MAVGLFYTLEFTNVEQRFVKVLIGDRRVVETDTPVIIPLDPAGTPLVMSTIDNEENKFSPIRAQHATITFLSNNQTSLETFADGPDDAFPVSILYGTQIIFYGFLSLADNSEAFISGRNEVTLTANDKLGALKDVPFTDFDNFNPQGKYQMAGILMMCLQKTGLDLKLRVMNNLRHGTGEKTFQATFGSPSAPFILMDQANTAFFYVGQRVQISGTVSNNVEFTVVSVTAGFVGVIGANVDFTLEADVNTTFTDESSEFHIYQHSLDAKTFEEEIGTCENCESVIKKILGNDCFLTQYKECWWIMRVDEFDANPMYVSRFDENGQFEDRYIETTLLKNIGFLETHYFSEEATSVLPTRPVNSAKLNYNFNYPLEIVCNVDFSRGVLLEEMGDEVINGETLSVKRYDIECWTTTKGNPDSSEPTTITPYIKKYFTEQGDEVDHYVVLPFPPAFDVNTNYIKSEMMPVSIQDKFDVSVDYRFSGEVPTGTEFMLILWVRFLADDGTKYNLGGEADLFTNKDAIKWFPANDTWETVFPPHGPLFKLEFAGIKETEWNTASWEAPPLPKSGNVFFQLHCLNTSIFGFDDLDIHYQGLKITYKPYIGGSYTTYKGHSDKITNTADGYLAKVEDEVFIADGERKLFKGAIFFIGEFFELTSHWYDASKFALGSPDLTRVKSYGELQAYSVWNQYRLANRVFQFQSQGLGDDIPSLVHKFSITDVSSHSNDRKFLLLTKEADLFLCTVTGTLEQVYHTIEGKEYTSPHEFKYIS